MPGRQPDLDGSPPCIWTGKGNNGYWPDSDNWAGGRLPGPTDVARIGRFSGPSMIEIPTPTTIGRIEVERESANDKVVLSGPGPLVLNGIDRLMGKPTTLQVMRGTLEFRDPIQVHVAGPRFSALPGGHLRISSSGVSATVPDIKLAISQTARMTLSVPYWEPHMDWDISTASTQGLGHRIIHYDHTAHQGPMGLSFNRFKEHDGDVLLVTGFCRGDYLRFKEDPRISTDPGKSLQIENIRFRLYPHGGAAEIKEKDGYWYFLPAGTTIPDTQVHRIPQSDARRRNPGVSHPVVHLNQASAGVLAPSTNHFPRNMGGDLVRLRDGRYLLAYSQWTTGTMDDDQSRVVGRISSDRGENWGEIFPVSEPDENRDSVRMPSFVRLGDGRLALFVRCHRTMREKWVEMMTCRDESAASLDVAAWSEPVRVTPAPPGGHVIIASRVIRTRAGRLIVPIATPWPWTRTDGKTDDIRSTCMISEDDGVSWRQSGSTLRGPGRGLMEPSIVETASGRLMMLMRTQMHRQYCSYSKDGGDSWSPATEVTRLISPESPAAVALDPHTGWIVVVWNRNSNLGKMKENRTPLTVGFSHDAGRSWFGVQNLEEAPGKTWFYPSIRFIDGKAHVIYSERTETSDGETRIALKTRIFRVEGTNDSPARPKVIETA